MRLFSVNRTHQRSEQVREQFRGYTVSGQAHSLSAWFVLALRFVMGWAFAWSGATKILGVDARLERYEVGGKALVERYPVLDYVLG